jgi:hypothetical protein
MTYNTQQKPYKLSELFGIDLSDYDFIFLQRCRLELAQFLGALYGFKVNWQNSTDADTGVGLCVLSKNDAQIKLVQVSVTIDPEDGNQSDKYQEVKFDGYTILNFLPPFIPDEEILTYIRQFIDTEFDIAVGDTHVGVTDIRRCPPLMALLKDKKLLNKKPNFKGDSGILQLNWIIQGSDKLYMTDEQAEVDASKERCHFPITFTLNKKEST